MDDIFEANKNLLKSTLLDEGKLITYISISKDLCVHVNISKIILQRLVEHVRQESSDLQLNVCYIISGAINNNNARTVVCAEQDLSTEKKLYKNIFFEHIYSVTKGYPSIDTAAYLTVNKFEDFALCSGQIKSKQCDKRTVDEIGELKSNSQDIIVPEKSKTLSVLSKIKQETIRTKNGHTEVKFLSRQDMDSKSEQVIKQEVVSPQKNTTGTGGMNKLKLSSINGEKTQKGIAGFFTKTNIINKKEIKETLPIGKEMKQETEIIDLNCDKTKVEGAIPMIKVKIEEKKESNNKILNQIKKNSRVDKKRKRVLHVSDSESDNENNDPFIDQCIVGRDEITNNSEDEIPATPTVTNIVIKSGIVNPKKRRKVVDKTYTDEDGYILTKKVEVYESCSENEEEVKMEEKSQRKKINNETSPKCYTSGPKKKVSPLQKGKQSTLTNFFKKI